MSSIVNFLSRTRGKNGPDLTDWLSWFWLLVGTLIVAIPIAWAAVSSLKQPSEIQRFPPSFLPVAPVQIQVEGYDSSLGLWEAEIDGDTRELALIRRIGIQAQMVDPENPGETINVPTSAISPVESLSIAPTNYTDPLERFNFLTYLKNSVFVTTMATILTLLLNSMAAFALSKYKFRGRNAMFIIIISTLMIPLSVVIVPAFLVVVGLNMIDNLWGVILPTIATPTGVFLLRQYMLTIPDELIEAARIDAASEFRIFWRVVLPLTAPALAVLAIFSVIWRWNDFLWPLIVLIRPDNFTLQVGLNAFQGQFTTQWHYILAMTMLSLAPVTVIFVFLQRYITAGIANTGIK
ncbi:sn-glycerol-3-phosphate transport system permease protein UgpE [Devosia pacifica]|uniref:Sn-glycerol-3-phosphate transport system permease protein UgpE n=1 Tax=Devosia pacifica TaxID=1335967 RepID=A0A918SF23_9HYPH|nr:carbohydrate ABC transporter permease [Devosia pacifica]GHA35795.1 sn-glycerol-3-phosphate transport system permease protein UgpE [Devosia pacifica]